MNEQSPVFDVGVLWRPSNLSAGVELLARRIGVRLNTTASVAASQPASMAEAADLVAARLGVGLKPVSTTRVLLGGCLASAVPVLIYLEHLDRVLLVARAGAKHLHVVDDQGKLQKVSRRLVEESIGIGQVDARGPAEKLATAVGGNERVFASILRDDSDQRAKVFVGWLLDTAEVRVRDPIVGPSFLVRAGLVILVHLAQYGFWIASWVALARLILEPDIDVDLFVLWALALTTVVLFQSLETWLQASLNVRFGSVLKQALLASTLAMDKAQVRQNGLGQLIARMLESNTVDTLATSGAIGVVLAAFELAVVGALIAAVIGISLLLGLYLAVIVTLGVLCVRYFRRLKQWHAAHLKVTATHAEEMVGHRTRKATVGHSHWYEAEDRDLADYSYLSKQLDGTAVQIDLLPRLVLLLGALVVLISSFVSRGSLQTMDIAAQIGLVLLVFGALQASIGGLTQLLQASVALQRLTPILRRRRPGPPPVVIDRALASGDCEVRGLSFRYAAEGPLVLKECDLVLGDGERMVLSGASGGGKSTLAAVLSGRLGAEQGLVLVNGLDAQVAGEDEWRKLVGYVPQRHDNHIVTDTLAFNLLMGRQWPPSHADVALAMKLLYRLGLGALLENMPAGMGQMIGENGWRLSQGEQARLFIARGLLQNPSLLIADEVLSALDPTTAIQVLDCAESGASKVLLIHHD